MVQWYAPWDHPWDQIQDRFFWHFLSLVLLRKLVFHAHTKLARRRGTVLLNPLCNCNVFQHTGLFGLLQSVRARRFYNPRGPNKSAERMGKITETQRIGKTNRRNSETQQIGGTNRRGRPNSAADLGGGGGGGCISLWDVQFHANTERFQGLVPLWSHLCPLSVQLGGVCGLYSESP